jgi:hypothetical protein
MRLLLVVFNLTSVEDGLVKVRTGIPGILIFSDKKYFSLVPLFREAQNYKTAGSQKTEIIDWQVTNYASIENFSQR